MSATLFSHSWYKVANLKVRLRKHASIHRHVYRDNVFYVLQDHATGQFQRFTPQAYQLIGLMDGKNTLQQIWDSACQKLGDDLPSQDEVIQLVSQLNKANVIQTNALPDIEQLQRRRDKFEKSKILQQLKSPLSIKIPLVDPESVLNSTSFLAKVIFSKFGAILWLSIVLFGGALAVINWQGLTENLSDKVLGIDNLLIMAFVYPIVKLVHEMGHGYAVKRWGGEVHEMGVMLLIFIPVPYVDASAASSFRNKYQRMLVGAVGVLGELLMAAIAMIVWVSVEPGLVRAMAYNVMLIGGVSTLLFNGNPLLRFDAYYVLADYLEIPNLGNRGNQQVAYLLKRFGFGIKGLKTTSRSRSESAWLVGYSCAAYIYRLFVMVAISVFVASQYFVVGVLLAFWSVWTSLFLPIIKMVSKPMTDPQMRTKRPRIFLVSGLFLSLILVCLFVVPLPYKTYSQGVLYVPQEAFVRVSVSGFIDEVLVEDGMRVFEQQPVIRMRAPDLLSQVKVLSAQVNEARTRYEASVGDRSGADILLEELRFIEKELQRANERLSGLTLKATGSGEFVIPNRDGIIDRFYNRGEVLGYVVDYKNLPLTVMISEDDIDQVRNQTKGVTFRFASQPNIEYTGSVLRQVPASTQQMPSAILTTEGGGAIALDPNRESDLQSYQSYFRIELDSSTALKSRFDERVHVLFEHEPEPVIWRWVRDIRRVFLRQFDV
ncbi:peptidase M50 [Vibrio algarum]|uniref:Peptidase M50 n=1 Tax=Vibrio algarum TaxID=3020714 RepID=A0ABT4YXE0_9VIBR|nr:peptidase M50 [Vibrio sp. KJ40-1]MDB1126130.1 peptidase M50 [Vibrio sp. KJ40-1]